MLISKPRSNHRSISNELRSLEKEELCTIEDPPCECPDYSENYYATFFADPDGLRYEFVSNERFLQKKKAGPSASA